MKNIKYVYCSSCNKRIQNKSNTIKIHNNSIKHKNITLKNNIYLYIAYLFNQDILEYNLIKDYILKYSVHYIIYTDHCVFKYDNYNNLSLKNKMLLLKIDNEFKKLNTSFLVSLTIFIIMNYL